MRAMLEALLDISRLDAGLVEATPRDVALEPLLDEILTALRDEAESHDMVVSTAGRKERVHADPTFLSRVLHNLATNAVRHARRGRVLIAVRTRREQVVVQVWDQGPGIAEGDRERIFDEYVQLENRERDRRKGLGLGLPMVRRMCEIAEWPLEIRSTPGRGTMFQVTLPRAKAVGGSEETSRPHALARSLRVLLVEDDLLVRDAVVACLEASGCVVHVASNVEEARLMLAELGTRATRPDVIVSDHRLPGSESGADFVRTQVSDEAGVPAVLMTGDDLDDGLVEDATSHVAILRKPVSAETLWKAIHRVTRKSAEAQPSIERAL
jgi:CheY-like chemotaxis protein